MITGFSKFGASRRGSMRAAAAGLAACVGALSAAPAQAQEIAEAGAIIVEELSILKLEDLDFGNIAGTAAGTIVMTPTATATCAVSASLVHTQECQPATFIGKGSFNQRLRIRKPNQNRITITEPGGATMQITGMNIDADPDLNFIRDAGRNSFYRIADPGGFFIFRVGGTLNVGANQAPGEYTATFEIDVAYR